MAFVPAGEIIGSRHQVRTVTIKHSPVLPDGEYSFVDSYCTEVGCDCRKTMINVVHNDQTVAIINFGWESETYYKNWMGGEELHSTSNMHGASVDFFSPNIVNPDAIIGLFKCLLNDIWVAKFKNYYKEVRRIIS